MYCSKNSTRSLPICSLRCVQHWHIRRGAFCVAAAVLVAMVAAKAAQEPVLVRVNIIVRHIRRMSRLVVAAPAVIRAVGKNGGQCQGHTCIAHAS